MMFFSIGMIFFDKVWLQCLLSQFKNTGDYIVTAQRTWDAMIQKRSVFSSHITYIFGEKSGCSGPTLDVFPYCYCYWQYVVYVTAARFFEIRKLPVNNAVGPKYIRSFLADKSLKSTIASGHLTSTICAYSHTLFQSSLPWTWQLQTARLLWRVWYFHITSWRNLWLSAMNLT